jgi:hypothetical protein
MFSIAFCEVALRSAKYVKRGTVRFLSGTIKIQLSPPTFLILKLFIRRLLVGVREGFGVGISLSYKWKQIGVFLCLCICMNLLAPETNPIMALKIKDYSTAQK